MFDQQTWTGVWSDDLIGSALSANAHHDVDQLTCEARFPDRKGRLEWE